MAASWRLANALVKLRDAINARWPKRSKASDGTIGDAAHASRSSDHNPWVKVGGQGVVRASDTTAAGIDAGWLAEKLRQMGAAGDIRLRGGGYIIFNRRITSPDFRVWKAYSGTNPHTKHVHTSFSTAVAGFDSNAPFNLGGVVTGPAPVPATSGAGVIKKGMKGALVLKFQKFLNRCYPSYSKLALDSDFGPATEKVVMEFQRRSGLVVDGIAGPVTQRKMNFA